MSILNAILNVVREHDVKFPHGCPHVDCDVCGYRRAKSVSVERDQVWLVEHCQHWLDEGDEEIVILHVASSREHVELPRAPRLAQPD